MIRNFTLRNYILYFFAAFCLISCEKDEIKPINADSVVPEFTGRIISSKDLIPNTMVYSRLMEYLEKPVAKSSYGIELDTSHIKVMETERYTSYTFKIHQDAEERKNVLRNFVLTYVNDTIQLQHTVDYPVLEDGNFDLDNAQMVRLYGDDLLTGIPMKCGGETMQSYTFEYCYTTQCLGTGHHDYGEYCRWLGTPAAATRTCVTRWRWESIAEDPCGTINDGGYDTSGTGGSGTATADEQPDEEDDILIGMDPNDGIPAEKDKDCQFLNNLVKNDSINANIKPEVQTLRSLTSRDMEYSIGYTKALVAGEEITRAMDEGIEQGYSKSSSFVRLGPFAIGVIHTHPEGTHPMFSFEDVFALIDIHDSLRPEFRSEAFIMIVNHDRSVYSLKIEDISQLKEEMANIINLFPSIVEIPAVKEQLTYELGLVYDNDISSSEGIFLNAFKNSGISLYKASSDELTSWDKLELSDINNPKSIVTKKPCK